MKNAVVALAAWVCIALPAAAHPGQNETPKTTKEERAVSPYHNIKVNGPFEVTLVSGTAGTLTLKGETGMLSQITTTVTDGTLSITLAEGYTLPEKKHVEITVPFETMNRIDLVGNGCINIDKTIKTDVKVTVDGCGTISLKTASANVEAWVLGPGQLKIKGSADIFTCKIIGCGSVQGYDLEAKNVTAQISGPGAIEIDCTKAITGKINGNGSISFTGNPAEKDLKRSGSGEFTML